MPTAEMTVVASFGDGPEKIEVILPAGDPQVMLAEVATNLVSGFLERLSPIPILPRSWASNPLNRRTR
jgi:hypothetical protein